MKTRIVIDIEIDCTEDYYAADRPIPANYLVTTVEVQPMRFAFRYSISDKGKLERANWHPETMLRVMCEDGMKRVSAEWVAEFNKRLTREKQNA